MTKKNRYFALKAAGLCTVCGKAPPVPGLTLCAECREKTNRRFRERSEQRSREGRCVRCGAPLREGGRFANCFNCRLEMAKLASERYRRKKSETDKRG